VHTAEEKIAFLTKLAHDIYQQREDQLGNVLMRQIEKFVLLSVIDNLWMNHLDAMDNLRQGIGLRGYAQRDPLVEYKNEGFRMFEELMWEIDDQVVHRIYKVQVQNDPAPQNHEHIHTNTPESEVSEDNRPKKQAKTKAVSSVSTSTEEEAHKLGRNDPCWCGSGKKWKKCHYPTLPA